MFVRRRSVMRMSMHFAQEGRPVCSADDVRVERHMNMKAVVVVIVKQDRISRQGCEQQVRNARQDRQPADQWAIKHRTSTLAAVRATGHFDETDAWNYIIQ